MISSAGEDRDDPAEVMAAVDLGSNSFHMIVARAHHGQLAIVDRLKEMVRLAAGLSGKGRLDEESQARALACLRRFGQRLGDMHADNVQVVGTNTLRRARHSDTFIAAAEEALGHPISVISGFEEARLIYSGVAHSVESSEGRRLVLDIGGGSTELIIGEGFEPQHVESLYIGCAWITNRFFADGRLTKKRFSKARMAVRLELLPVAATFRRIGWSRAIGSSGTIRATSAIAHELGLADTGVTPAAVEAIIGRMIAANRLEDLDLPGLSVERRPVFPAGIVILAEMLSNLGIDHMDVSEGALREGLLYEMLGRAMHDDARDRTIVAFQRRYHVDVEQADRVEATVANLFLQVAAAWGLAEDPHLHLLVWAARLHEVGLDISHSKYQEHGGYLLEHADLPGFVHLEQRALATLVNYHRRKLDKLSLEHFQPRWRGPVFRMIVLVRLAVLLNRTRSAIELPDIRLSAKEEKLELMFPDDWFESNPLTEADLEQERGWLKARGFELTLLNQDSSASRDNRDV